MGYRLREMAGAHNFAQELKLDVLSRTVPPEMVQAALQAEGAAPGAMPWAGVTFGPYVRDQWPYTQRVIACYRGVKVL